jgi:hypothetical protein
MLYLVDTGHKIELINLIFSLDMNTIYKDE